MIEDLQKIGFAKNEAIIYELMVKLNKCKASELIKITGFHRNIVYDNLSKLEEKGLLSSVIEDSSRSYKINSVGNIIEILENKKTQLNNKIKTAQKIKSKLESISRTKQISDAQIFRGANGVRQILREMLKKNTTQWVIGAPKQSIDIMGEVFWKNYNLKLKSQNMDVFMLFSEDLRDWVKSLKFYQRKIRYLDKQLNNLTEIIIKDDLVVTIVWSQIPNAFLIKDKEVAIGYKKHFEVLWNNSMP